MLRPHRLLLRSEAKVLPNKRPMGQDHGDTVAHDGRIRSGQQPLGHTNDGAHLSTSLALLMILHLLKDVGRVEFEHVEVPRKHTNSKDFRFSVTQKP